MILSSAPDGLPGGSAAMVQAVYNKVKYNILFA